MPEQVKFSSAHKQVEFNLSVATFLLDTLVKTV